MKTWLTYHSATSHLLGPIWARVPERSRWRIVGWLNKSRRYCWCDLVDAALCHREDDACDIRLPRAGDKGDRCKTVCDWGRFDHTGEHDCCCYCGKFQFRAIDGARDRNGGVFS